MLEKDILQEALRVLPEALGKPVAATDTPNTLGMDSLDEMDAVLAIETALKIELPEELQEMSRNETIAQWAKKAAESLK